uniref:Uncharacterized protein n=1 Tax=Parascaris univalens TaxID=6257 RepID=A0A915CJ41_PARUN
MHSRKSCLIYDDDIRILTSHHGRVLGTNNGPRVNQVCDDASGDEIFRPVVVLQDKNALEEKSAALVRLVADSGEEEKREKEAEKAKRRARNKIEALAKGMTIDEHGAAVTLDAQLAGSSISHPSIGKERKELKAMAAQSARTMSAKKGKLEEEFQNIEVRCFFIHLALLLQLCHSG